jgi:hypothetical protein
MVEHLFYPTGKGVTMWPRRSSSCNVSSLCERPAASIVHSSVDESTEPGVVDVDGRGLPAWPVRVPPPQAPCSLARRRAPKRRLPRGGQARVFTQRSHRLRLPPSSLWRLPGGHQGGRHLDDVAHAWWDSQFQLRFLLAKGSAFQELFCKLMELGHPGDFQRVRPWGSAGDRKNDGYLRSQRILFQVYGPNEMTAAAAIAKIHEDFHGALPYWEPYFDQWTFVHNSPDGLSPQVTAKLLELDAGYPPKTIPWGYAELRLELFRMPDDDIGALLGPAPTRRTVQQIGMKDLQPLIDQLGRLPATQEPDLRPVPPDKLSLNLLSDSVAALLRVGMTKADLVDRYFGGHHDPTYRDEVAEKFRRRYEELRSEGLSPDRVFDELRIYIGGSTLQSAEYDAALLAILAYFFESCDIFERPIEAGQT